MQNHRTVARLPLVFLAVVVASNSDKTANAQAGNLSGGNQATAPRESSLFPQEGDQEIGCERRGTLFQWTGSDDEWRSAEVSPITTDRPDFTESSATVGWGVVQVETGYTYFSDDDGGFETRIHSAPETLVRMGLLDDWFEFRVAFNYLNESSGGIRRSGADDLYLGMKLALTEQDAILPEMAIVPQMKVPTGGSAITQGETIPGVNWLYGWDVGERLGVGGSTQFNRAVDGLSGEGYTLWAQSWTVNVAISERWGGYAEWFGLFPHSADTDPCEHYFDGGLTYRWNDDVQWDLRGGTGLSQNSLDYFVGLGLSIRFRGAAAGCR